MGVTKTMINAENDDAVTKESCAIYQITFRINIFRLRLQNVFSCSLPMSHLTNNSTRNYVGKWLSIKCVCVGGTYDRALQRRSSSTLPIFSAILVLVKMAQLWKSEGRTILSQRKGLYLESVTFLTLHCMTPTIIKPNTQ